MHVHWVKIVLYMGGKLMFYIPVRIAQGLSFSKFQNFFLQLFTFNSMKCSQLCRREQLTPMRWNRGRQETLSKNNVGSLSLWIMPQDHSVHKKCHNFWDMSGWIIPHAHCQNLADALLSWWVVLREVLCFRMVWLFFVTALFQRWLAAQALLPCTEGGWPC